MRGSGLNVPALFIGVLLQAGTAATAADAQARPQATPAPQALVPDASVVLKLIWSTLAAVDHANLTGNYSVLRDLGSPNFQANHNAASLAGVFQGIRTQRIDLSSVLLVTPTYEIQPTIVDGGLLRVRGAFPLRPNAIGFDLLYQPVGGRWQLFGIAVAPLAQQIAAPPRRR
jgi:hypothetical protein